MSSSWINRYAALGPEFHTELPAAGLPEPHWVARSEACAELLGLPPGWADDEALNVFSGNLTRPGMRPLATVYSGHQFGVWAGQLGDGRALMLGEVETPNGPMEVQLKGAGKTPYSRMGDGRAVLRSSIREFLCSEAMAALGIPTTRALCITGSALPVRRETIETAAVVTRVAPSFMRFGHFEHFAHSGQHAALKKLADFFIEHHAPECKDTPNAYVALLDKVTRQTAALMADWTAVGFSHGVMNTDNMSLLGLTIDYGPFGFMDAFDPGFICNHSDECGRYAFGRQANVAFWNLHALAQAMLPLLADEMPHEQAGETLLGTLEAYKTAFPMAMLARLRAKLGLLTEQADDQALADDFLKLMATARADFTITFRALCDFATRPEAVRDHFLDRAAFDAWAGRYTARLAAEGSDPVERALRMKRTNPSVVLRNHLAENAIRAASAGDFGETARLLKVLQSPYDEPAQPADAALPPEWAQHLEVSCSS